MSSLDTIKTQIQKLIASAKAKTGNSASDLTSQVNVLIAGYNTGGGSANPVLQSKSVNPSETAQNVTFDNGYDGLSNVSVGAISKTYIGSQVLKKALQTYTPGTTDQEIADGQYLQGKQTLKGDPNLIPSNIKNGVTIFGKQGTFVGSSSAPNLQSKTVTPTKSTQSVTPDTASGYDGLSEVTVNPIPAQYIEPVGTKIITTNGTSDVTSYASVNVNVPTGGGASSNNNCEAYKIADATAPKVTFKNTTGALKVWGYGEKKVSTYSTTRYVFLGDSYKTVSYTGLGTATSMTLSVDESGNISGLPTLDSGTLLVTRGV